MRIHLSVVKEHSTNTSWEKASDERCCWVWYESWWTNKSGQPVYILQSTAGLSGWNNRFKDILSVDISRSHPFWLISSKNKTHIVLWDYFSVQSINFLKTPTKFYDFPAPCVEPSVVLPTLRWSCGVANAWRCAGPWFGWFRIARRLLGYPRKLGSMVRISGL